MSSQECYSQQVRMCVHSSLSRCEISHWLAHYIRRIERSVPTKLLVFLEVNKSRRGRRGISRRNEKRQMSQKDETAGDPPDITCPFRCDLSDGMSTISGCIRNSTNRHYAQLVYCPAFAQLTRFATVCEHVKCCRAPGFVELHMQLLP